MYRDASIVHLSLVTHHFSMICMVWRWFFNSHVSRDLMFFWLKHHCNSSSSSEDNLTITLWLYIHFKFHNVIINFLYVLFGLIMNIQSALYSRNQIKRLKWEFDDWAFVTNYHNLNYFLCVPAMQWLLYFCLSCSWYYLFSIM